MSVFFYPTVIIFAPDNNSKSGGDHYFNKTICLTLHWSSSHCTQCVKSLQEHMENFFQRLKDSQKKNIAMGN